MSEKFPLDKKKDITQVSRDQNFKLTCSTFEQDKSYQEWRAKTEMTDK